MKLPVKNIGKNLFKAFVAVIFIGGTFHLMLLAIVALKRADPSYINPIDFLGIGYAFPSLANNRSVAITAWLLIFLSYFVVLYLVIHYHRYLGIVQNTKSYKMAVDTAKKVQKKSKNSSSPDTET